MCPIHPINENSNRIYPFQVVEINQTRESRKEGGTKKPSGIGAVVAVLGNSPESAMTTLLQITLKIHCIPLGDSLCGATLVNHVDYIHSL